MGFFTRSTVDQIIKRATELRFKELEKEANMIKSISLYPANNAAVPNLVNLKNEAHANAKKLADLKDIATNIKKITGGHIYPENSQKLEGAYARLMQADGERVRLNEAYQLIDTVFHSVRSHYSAALAHSH